MLTVIYSCLTTQHDLRLVVLAGMLCLFACFSAINLFAHAAEAKGRARWTWLTGAAVVFGAGVWATHFVAELAYKPGMPVGYDVNLTVLSIAVAMALTWIGMVIALNTRASEIGGAVVGAAVGGMHYVGMAALRVPADLHWNFSYVGLSIAIGIGLGAAAFRLEGMGSGLRYRLGAGVLLVLAICGLHFTAMAGVVLVPDPTVAIPGEIIAPDLLAITVAAVTVLIIALGLSSAFVDDQLAHRAISEAERLSARIAERTAELQSAQEQLLRQERFGALMQLTATMAHELRNPLSAIANTVHVVKHTTSDAGLDLARPLGRIERSIARCERIIGDMLDYSRLRELRTKTWPADSWLEEALDDVKLPEGVTLVRRLEAPNCRVAFDDELMRRALGNILENAVQAVTEAEAPARIITVATSAVDGACDVSIADTGPGIPADLLTKVFEPLFSTKSFGTGLGLPMVKQIVERHNGTVAIASAPGEGTRVVMRLPASIAGRLAA